MRTVRSSGFIAFSAMVAWLIATYPGDPSLGLLRRASAPPIAEKIDRAHKTDSLAGKRIQRAQERAVATVELVGLRDPAIIYRDRDGRVLFQTDPLTNITTVAKGAVLPEITVRETAQSAARRVPVTPSAATSRDPPVPPPDLRRKPQTKPVIPEGCDPAASPIASPELAHVLSKCMVEAPGASRLASLDRY
jgi:hypothetical protein